MNPVANGFLNGIGTSAGLLVGTASIYALYNTYQKLKNKSNKTLSEFQQMMEAKKKYLEAKAKLQSSKNKYQRN